MLVEDSGNPLLRKVDIIWESGSHPGRGSSICEGFEFGKSWTLQGIERLVCLHHGEEKRGK